ncbi:hypothetical protein BST81_20075 [Leptolyngbya sp. 'hensonii']|nr:hypothetical protein BST81_20075 [Leptolyngbya sp. 'hensonii']
MSVLGCFVDEGDILLIHQMTFPEPDCWDLPGGGLRPEETLMAGLFREVREETGIEAFRVDRLLTVVEGFFPEGENRQLHGVNLIYQCSVDPRPLVLQSADPEIGPKGIRWLPITELTPDICSARSWQAIQAIEA